MEKKPDPYYNCIITMVKYQTGFYHVMKSDYRSDLTFKTWSEYAALVNTWLMRKSCQSPFSYLSIVQTYVSPEKYMGNQSVWLQLIDSNPLFDFNFHVTDHALFFILLKKTEKLLWLCSQFQLFIKQVEFKENKLI